MSPKNFLRPAIGGLCLAACLSLAGDNDTGPAPASQKTNYLVGWTPADKPDQTGRVSHDEFIKAHPQFAHVDFSAIGELHYKGRSVCSAVVLEPGNLVATNQHCIDVDRPEKHRIKFKNEKAYTFVTRDAHGTAREIPLPLHGIRYYQYLHMPTIRYFDPSVDLTDKLQFEFQVFDRHMATDIAFIELTEPVPADITPARIAPAQTETLKRIFAAGYSPHVREKDGQNDTGLSITGEFCTQTLYSEDRNLTLSDCHIDKGDSGGIHFFIDDRELVVTAIQHKSYHKIDSDDPYRKDLNRKFKAAGLPETQRHAVGTTLPNLQKFCRETMVPDYCTGFPGEAPNP